jgi:replicative superfamily II helicase
LLVEMAPINPHLLASRKLTALAEEPESMTDKPDNHESEGEERVTPQGLLKSRMQGVGRRARRLYRATPKGRKALAAAKHRVRELFGELIEGK